MAKMWSSCTPMREQRSRPADYSGEVARRGHALRDVVVRHWGFVNEAVCRPRSELLAFGLPG